MSLWGAIKDSRVAPEETLTLQKGSRERIEPVSKAEALVNRRLKLVVVLVGTLAQMVITTCGDEIVRRPLRTFGESHPQGITAVAASSNGTQVLTAHYEEHTVNNIRHVEALVRLWDTGTGALLHEFTGHTAIIYSVAFSPDGLELVTGSFDGTARRWSSTTGSLLRTFQHSDSIISVAFTPDGMQVVTSSEGSLRFWDASTGQLLKTLPLGVYSFALSPDGTTLLTGNLNWMSQLLDVSSQQILHVFPGQTNVTSSVAFSPDGSKLLIANAGVTLYDSATGQRLSAFDDRQVSTVAFSPDGHWVLTGNQYSGATLWDPLLKQPLGGFAGPSGVLAFLPDSTGTRIVTGGDDGILRLYDIRSLLANLRAIRVGSVTQLTWDLGGRLQEADNPNGPWQDVINASSPYHGEVSAGQKLYRVLVSP